MNMKRILPIVLLFSLFIYACQTQEENLELWKQEIVETVYAGDIAAAVGLKDTKTGDTISDEKNPIILESMQFP